jgi:Anti-sigma factor NepR
MGRASVSGIQGTSYLTVPGSGTGGENCKMRQRKPSRPAGSAMDNPFLQSASSRTQGRLGRDIQAKIGSQLRAIYDDVVQEGVPERFVELLKRLDRKDERGSDS